MERILFSTLAIVILATGGAFAQSTTAVTVVGQNDLAIDRQAIQDAIDDAGPGSAVELVGTFQLDGQRIQVGVEDLELRGTLVDDDGDGRFNEDWADGRDNDGDGAVDEDGWDAVLRGVTGPGGQPVLDDGVNALFNRAFVVDGADPPVAGLVVRDLAFEGFHRAIELIPEWESATGRCEDRIRVPGSMSHVLIEGNRFSNNELGITMLGDLAQPTIRGNVFERHGIFGAVVEGEDFRCPLTGGSFVVLALGTPREVTIHGNLGFAGPLGTRATARARITDNRIEDGVFGVLAQEDAELQVSGNRIDGAFLGIVLFDVESARVLDNTATGAFVGIDLVGPGAGVLVATNEVAATIGVWVESGGSGYQLVENAFPASGFVDVLLDLESRDNLVVNGGAPITVLDLGTDNRLVGNVTPF